MRKNRFLVVTVLSVAIVCTTTFVSCKKDKSEEPNITYTLTVLSNDNKMGTVTGSGSYTEGTEATLTATPASEACVFVKWSDGNTENPRTLTVTGNLELTATFGYAFVDLGLPSGVKWATCNVGASSPFDTGDYFAWGEVTPKHTYSWITYKWYKGADGVFSKYCTDDNYGVIDNKTTLDLTDDAAHVNMGGAWRIPTNEEVDELRNYCNWVWMKNIGGYMVTGVNGNAMFLPAAGYCENSNVSDIGVYGNYWSNSLNEENPTIAYYLGFRSTYTFKNSYNRCYGRSVRGVFK